MVKEQLRKDFWKKYIDVFGIEAAKIEMQRESVRLHYSQIGIYLRYSDKDTVFLPEEVMTKLISSGFGGIKGE